ncbi:AraC family transcriptional regulator [Microbulbifer bruguierae]|uniref:AraC family transcriptional regulator n=1 Tax=Microbulbifer bruguierae TaxID=3029061 RepID=A0ABY8NHC3_9GAMM|nr:AraC family transcriptional regulator [Microbulbifer bruguierae]WGL18321.1 AraC family transcriptional regulator [Microbulbifer bruguierae]
MNFEHAVMSGWLILMVRAMQACDIDVPEALAACEIQWEELGDLESRVTLSKLVELLNYASARAPEHDMRVMMAENFHPSMLHVLGYAMMSAPSLCDGLDYIVRYRRIVSSLCNVRLQEVAGGFEFGIRPVRIEQRVVPGLGMREAEVFLASLVKFARDLVSSDLTPLCVYLEAEQPSQQVDPLQIFFGCEIHYGHSYNAVVFPRELATRKLLTHNSFLARSHEAMLDEYLARVDKSDLVNLIRCKIYDYLPGSAPAQTEVAEALGMSLRNLQRRLSELGTSYKDILEQTRKQLAVKYMGQSNLSLGEIGYLVGFSSVTNFNRAFKRWTGQTPGDYRENRIVNQLN